MESPQDPGQEPAQSQEQPQQDSGLQTPQPDQPVPTEPEREPQQPPQTDDSQVSQPDSVGGSIASPGPSGEPAEGTVGASSDQQASAAVQREQELEADRRARQERLGNEGEINEGEVQAQRQEHNQRTGGGDVPQA